MDIQRARTSAGVAAGILLAAVAATGCTASRAGQGQAAPTSVRTVTVTAPASTTAAAATSDSDTSEREAGGSAATTSRRPAVTSTAKQHVPARPRIESFTVVSEPSCPVVGTPDAPFSSPGAGVVIAWKISGAEGAAISVDNPGVYASYGGDYPATGQLELSFPCDGGSGETTHTYTVWPKGAEGVSKTLTVSARGDS